MYHGLDFNWMPMAYGMPYGSEHRVYAVVCVCVFFLVWFGEGRAVRVCTVCCGPAMHVCTYSQTKRNERRGDACMHQHGCSCRQRGWCRPAIIRRKIEEDLRDLSVSHRTQQHIIYMSWNEASSILCGFRATYYWVQSISNK